LVFQLNYLYIIILEIVPSTVIFWTELSCWRESYSNKAISLLGWSHRYKTSMVVITIWLTVTKYPDLKRQWICFTFYVDVLFPLSLPRLLPDYIWGVTLWVSYKKQELLTIREHPSSPRFIGVARIAYLF